MVTLETRSHNTYKVKQSIQTMTNGYFLSNNSYLKKKFGCHACSWIGTPLCPHNKKKGETHVNGICSQKSQFVKEFFHAAGTVPKMLQIEKLLSLQEMTDKMRSDWYLTGILPQQFSSLVKTEVDLMTKMREQQEGLRLHIDQEITINKFRETIDVLHKKHVDKKESFEEIDADDEADRQAEGHNQEEI